MRLASFLDGGADRLAVVSDGRALPLGDVDDRLPATMAALLAGGAQALAALREPVVAASDRIAREGVSIDTLELLSPVPRPGKVVAIGLNYRDHAREADLPPPGAPLVFGKFPSSVTGHRAEIRWDPALATQVDYEAELAVVIGRHARRVSEADALDYVLGYTCCNDVSARDMQFGDGQWVRGKSLDTFCPLGPVLVTADEIPDPQSLAIKCTLDGVPVQSSSTARMFFPVRALVSYCSNSFTLEPGDIIATGTPAGVGVFRSPQVFLGEGSRVVVEIERIGRLENICRLETPARAGSSGNPPDSDRPHDEAA
jgi:2-keto-4-pentenoate hydratase/2-oxohepta-3-ene-1,7-dioic acid hydratase in catechol pathway